MIGEHKGSDESPMSSQGTSPVDNETAFMKVRENELGKQSATPLAVTSTDSAASSPSCSPSSSNSSSGPYVSDELEAKMKELAARSVTIS